MAVGDVWGKCEGRPSKAVLAVLMMLVCWVSGVTVAQAATSSIANSPDPTEDKAVTLTISGQAEANRKLWVVAFPSTSGGCGYASANMLTFTQSDRTILINGDALPTGSYERTVDFTPPESRSYLICSLISPGLYDTPSTTASHIFQVRKPTASTSLSFSSGPVEEKEMTVTVSGQTEVDRGLWLVAFTDLNHRCDSQNANELTSFSIDRTILLNNDPIAAGSYERTATFTPPEATKYRVCAFVADGAHATPDAKTSATFNARAPKVTARISISADPAKDKTVTVKFSGQTELQRNLWAAVVHNDMYGCSGARGNSIANPTGSRRVLLKEIPLSPGSYERTVTFTPWAAGKYEVCAIVAETGSKAADAKVVEAFSVREKRALLNVVPVGRFQHLAKSSFRIDGLTEAAGQVEVLLQDQAGPCPAAPDLRTDGTVGGSEKGYFAQAGAFVVDGWFIPRAATKNRICAYLTDETDRVIGAASAEVDVERNPEFLPRLITADKARGLRRPPALRWRTGPGDDYIQVFRRKPGKTSRPLAFKRGVISFAGGEDAGRWKATFSRRYTYARGRYWWRIVRRDPVTGYEEASAPRSFWVIRPRR